jgi:acetyl esterase/lipase
MASRGARQAWAVEQLESRRLLSSQPGGGQLPAGSSDASLAVQVVNVHRGGPAVSGDVPAQQQTAGAGGKILSDVVYSRDGARLDVYAPSGPAPAGGRPVVIALPGGGFRWANKAEIGARTEVLCRYGYIVVAAEYAFSSPGVRSWPAAFEDVRDTVRWVRRHADAIGADPSAIAFLGESSGGSLAALAATVGDRPVEPGDPGAGPPPGEPSGQIQAVVDFYGPSDMTLEYNTEPRGRSYFVSYLGGTPSSVPDRYAAASAIDHVAPGGPPFLIFQGTRDKIVPYQGTIAFNQALSDAGNSAQLVLLDGATHGFHFSVGRTDLLPQVIAFLNAALGPHAQA